MGEPLLQNEYWAVSYEPERKLVRITRTSKPLPEDDHDLDLRGIEQKLARVERLRAVLLLDMRAGPLRNDPAFERQNARRNLWVRGFVNSFSRSAMLLGSAVGKLQVTRLQRERGDGTPAFLDENEALAHLGLGPVERHAPPSRG